MYLADNFKLSAQVYQPRFHLVRANNIFHEILGFWSFFAITVFIWF